VYYSSQGPRAKLGLNLVKEMKANEGGGEKFRGVIFIFLFAYSNPAVLPYRKVHFYVFFLGAFCHTGKFTSIF
jgi:hypothetical protein